MNYKIYDEISSNEYNKLRNDLGWDLKDNNIIDTALNKSAYIKKVEINDEIVGMARVIGDGIYYLIVDVIVSPKYQGMGLGKVLITELEKDIINNMNMLSIIYIYFIYIFNRLSNAFFFTSIISYMDSLSIINF